MNETAGLDTDFESQMGDHICGIPNYMYKPSPWPWEKVSLMLTNKLDSGQVAHRISVSQDTCLLMVANNMLCGRYRWNTDCTVVCPCGNPVHRPFTPCRD
jgi:hypothetical protein